MLEGPLETRCPKYYATSATDTFAQARCELWNGHSDPCGPKPPMKIVPLEEFRVEPFDFKTVVPYYMQGSLDGILTKAPKRDFPVLVSTAPLVFIDMSRPEERKEAVAESIRTGGDVSEIKGVCERKQDLVRVIRGVDRDDADAHDDLVGDLTVNEVVSITSHLVSWLVGKTHEAQQRGAVYDAVQHWLRALTVAGVLPKEDDLEARRVYSMHLKRAFDELGFYLDIVGVTQRDPELAKPKTFDEDDDRAARFVTNGPVRDALVKEFARVRALEREACTDALEDVEFGDQHGCLCAKATVETVVTACVQAVKERGRCKSS